MDTIQAFARGEASRGNEMMVFDWLRAAQMIAERKAESASAGLSGDWEWTGGEILRDGLPVPPEDTYVFLASTWATPEIEIGGETMDCFKMQNETPGWDSGTYWPDDAKALLLAAQ